MASYALDEFLGAGILKDMGVKFAEDGWDDVPTLKVIGAQDMETLALTDAERDALELRIYLHNRSLMRYADRMEASGMGLIDLMNMKPSDLASKFRMRKTHVAIFVDTSFACGIQMPPDLPRVLSSTRRRRPSPTASGISEDGDSVSEWPLGRPMSVKQKRSECTLPFSLHRSILSDASSLGSSYSAKDSPAYYPARKLSNAGDMGYELLFVMPNVPKGVFSAANSTSSSRMCGLVKAPISSDSAVMKISVLEKVSLRSLAPDQRNGVDPGTLKGMKKLQPFKASNLWSNKATLFFCIRRPGCVMCRAEAHQLFARKPIFDALGIQLVAVLLEDIDEEVWAFWPRYWAGMVVLDEKRDFFRALGGGKLMKDNLFTGFLLNPIARLNWKRAMKTGIKYNSKGEGLIKGGLFIVRRGRLGGVAYQFAEKNLGDWAPLDEVLQVCHIIRDEGDCDSY